jgi:hypothetical protein
MTCKFLEQVENHKNSLRWSWAITHKGNLKKCSQTFPYAVFLPSASCKQEFKRINNNSDKFTRIMNPNKCSTSIRFLMSFGMVVLCSLAQVAQADSSFGLTGAMNTNRYSATATMLANGKVLVAGGENNNGCLATAELFDPVSGTWTDTGSMLNDRADHIAVLLSNGEVLVAGGINSSGVILTNAELYNPVAGTWSNTAGLNTARAGFVATLLTNGLVLVAGGEIQIDNKPSTSEIYDPSSGSWAMSGTMIQKHLAGGVWTGEFGGPTATLLTNGTVLVVGGLQTNWLTSGAEWFNPGNQTWTPTLPMNYPRFAHGAVLLPNGKVLVTGGQTNYFSLMIPFTEIYDPASHGWTVAAPMNAPRTRFTCFTLTNGLILAAGGSTNGGTDLTPTTTAELYNPNNDIWTETGGFLNTARYNYAATALTGSTVLFVGGVSASYSNVLSSCEIYEPLQATPNPDNGFFWVQNGNTITITNYNGSEGIVTVPASIADLPVTAVAAGAFKNNPSLTNISLFGYVTSIGSTAFSGCSNLTTVSLPYTMTNLGDYAFSNCVSLTKVPIPDDLRTLNNGVFAGCSSLTDVTIPTGITNIEANVFSGCSKLAIVSIVPDLTNLGSSAFASCAALTNVCFEGNAPINSGSLIFNGDPLTNILYISSSSGWGATYQGIPTALCTACANALGALKVNILPNSLQTSAGWMVTGDPENYYFDSGAIIGVGVGNHTVSFKPVSGYLTPTNEIVTVTDGNITNITVTYFPATAGLEVTISPPAAVAAGAQWQVDGGAYQNSGGTVNNLGAGNHTISFNTISGWFKPANQIVTLTENTTNSVAVTFLPNVGDVQVNLEPTCAVAAGVQWQVDGGAWQTNGTLLTNVDGGNHTISFNTVPGWSPPANQIVLVTANTTNFDFATYGEAPTLGEITWIGVPGGDSHWSTATNWDLGRAPIASDIVLIPNTGGNACALDVSPTVAGLLIGECDGGGSDGVNLNGDTLTVNGPITVKDGAVLNLTSGTVVGTNSTVISGNVNWVATTLTGVMTIATNGILNLSGNNSSHNLSACLLTNLGVVNWSMAAIYGDGGSVVDNYGLWNAQDDQYFNAGSGTTFNNYGTFAKTGGTGNYPGTYFPGGAVFNQRAGMIDVQSGTNGLQLQLQGGGTFSGGFITTNAGGYVYLSSINGSGSYTINGAITSSNVVDSGGALIGTNVIRGAFTWQQGNWNNMALTIESNAVVYITANTGGKNISGSVITNFGAVDWSMDSINGDDNSVVYNYGLWNAQDDHAFSGGAGTTFNNYGTFAKTGGTGNYPGTYFPGGAVFNQRAGMIDVQSGTNGLQLQLQGGGTFSGGFITTNAGGYVYLSSINGSGSYNINGTVTSSNTVDVGGALIGTNVIRGAFTWQQGNWNNMALTIESNAVVYITANTGGKNISGSVITNFGAVDWSMDSINGDDNSVVYNYGLWNAQDDHAFSGGAGTTFNNYGTFAKTGGTGNYPGTYLPNGFVFNQLGGIINMQTGLLTISSGYEITNGTLNFAINNQTNFGSILLGNTVALGGTISASVSGAFAPYIGDQFQVLSSSGASGTFSRLNLPPGLAVNYPANGVILKVASVLPVELLNPQLLGGNLSFQIPTLTNQSYTILQNSNLTTADWIFFTNLTGDGFLVQVIAPTTNHPANFFRVTEP